MLQFRFANRFSGWDSIAPSAIADGTDFKIWEPVNSSWRVRPLFYSVKHGGPALRYMILCHCITGEVLWISEPYPGSASEINIVRENFEGLLQPGEKFLADRLFRNVSDLFVTPTGNRTDWDILLQSVRSLVERKIGRVKKFHIFQNTWRGDWDFHQRLLYVSFRMFNVLNKNNQ